MSRLSPMSGGNRIALVLLVFSLCSCLALTAFACVIWSKVLSRTDPAPLAHDTPPDRTSAPTSVPSPTAGEPLEHVPTRRAGLHLTPPATVVATPSPPALPPLPTPMADVLTTEGRLLAAQLPQRDLRLLAERLKKTGPIPEVVHQTPPFYELGDQAEFWVGNVDTMEQFRVTAVLQYVTSHLYVWIEDGLTYDQAALARSAENFEERIYPTNRAYFGSEWSPGVDNDLHLHILHSTGKHMGNSVAGYYSSADEFSQLANPYSNEREMFYVSLDSTLAPGTDFYDGLLAHEFQHMIHWASDRNEETWVNEGCAELAAYLNGYDPGGFERLFLANPDVQLTTWPEVASAASHYGGSYLFMAYFSGRFGEETVKRLVAHPANGVVGFDAVLSGHGLTFEEVFADWLVSNYVDGVANRVNDRVPQVEARYTYPDHVVGPASVDVTHDDYPLRRQSTVRQFAADYVKLSGRGDLLIEFQGDTEARLVPMEAHSGQYAWWSNRGDDSDATLTRTIDLRPVDRGTLQVWMWYDIEEHWDYAYVEVSTDGGRTWDILAGPSTTVSNPNGNSFGSAYTGSSGEWIQETFDLSPYAGQQVLARFEYVTDDAVNRVGWLIDDVCIPELDYCDDFESGPGDWQAKGFIYSDNRVSQRYLVQLIVLERQEGSGADTVRVLRVPLDEAQRGRAELRGLGGKVDWAMLVISALAPATTEVATYEYAIQPLQ